MNTLNLLLFTTLSLDYRLLKSLLVGVFLSFWGDVKMVLIFLVDFGSLWGLLGVSFGSIFRFIFVLILGGVKKSRRPRREPPRAAGSRRDGACPAPREHVPGTKDPGTKDSESLLH